MATLRQYRSDILLILSKSKVSKDFRVNPKHIDFLIHKYRASIIQDQYKATREIDPQCFQDLGRVTFTKVTSADDPNILVTSVSLGKLTIPGVIALPNDRGVWRVASSSRQMTYYPVEYGRFFEIVEDSIRSKFNYWFRIGTSLYTYPLLDEGNIVLLQDNPMEGIILATEDLAKDGLTVGVEYKVVKGQIEHNSVIYVIGDVFTAVSKIFTGKGTVKYNNQKRPITLDDQYPMSIAMAEDIAMKIYTQDFNIEKQEVANIKVDSQDQGSLDSVNGK